MLYNLRIGKSRFTGKSIAECCDIIAARRDDINTYNRTLADVILFDLHNLKNTYRRIAYYGHNGKVFISINRKKGEN